MNKASILVNIMKSLLILVKTTRSDCITKIETNGSVFLQNHIFDKQNNYQCCKKCGLLVSPGFIKKVINKYHVLDINVKTGTIKHS